MTMETLFGVPAHLAGAGALVTQQRTARVLPVRVLMEEPAWVEGIHSPVSVKMAGRDPPVLRTSTTATLTLAITEASVWME